jgi:GNAT superfamily N-acetyltransferase
MSFWKQSPGPHWSHVVGGFFRDSEPPHIFKESFEKPCFPYLVLGADHSIDIYNLLAQHYTMYPRSKISLTQQQICDFLEKEKCIAIGIYFNLSLVGVVFSRCLGFGMMGPTSIDNQQLGLIDFFCVHTKHRKKGIGSKLLHAMAYECAQRGYVAHLFLKEGMPLTALPPLYSSQYVWRPKKVPAPVNLSNFIHLTTELPRDSLCWNAPTTVYHTKVYECSAFSPPIFVGVTDLFHKAELGGQRMGEISWVWYNTKKGTHADEKLKRVVETVVDSCTDFDMLFMDSALPHDTSMWMQDALFSYYCWNLHPGTFFKTRLSLTF